MPFLLLLSNPSACTKSSIHFEHTQYILNIFNIFWTYSIYFECSQYVLNVFHIFCIGSLHFVHDQKWAHLSTAVAWREKKFKHFVFNKYFCLVLGVLKSKISKKFGEGFLRKLDFKLFHYKAMVQPVSKITTIATRNRCWM